MPEVVRGAMLTAMDDGRELLTIDEAAQVAKASYSAVWGWCARGVKTRGGERVYLPYQRLGRSIRIDRSELHAFGRRVAEADVAGRDAESARPERGRTRRQRDAAIKQAEQRLAAKGL